MSKFSGTNRRPLRVNLTGPIRTRGRGVLTHEGGDAFGRDPESDLFLLAATNMVGEDTFYERAATRDARFVDLWLATHGRALPMPVKRGVADAARRLYSERAVLRYDGLSRQVRMADVIELTHPSPRDARQSALFKYLLDRRHHDDAVADAAVLPTLAAAAALEAVPAEERRAVLRRRGPAALAEAGF